MAEGWERGEHNSAVIWRNVPKNAAAQTVVWAVFTGIGAGIQHATGSGEYDIGFNDGYYWDEALVYGSVLVPLLFMARVYATHYATYGNEESHYTPKKF